MDIQTYEDNTHRGLVATMSITHAQIQNMQTRASEFIVKELIDKILLELTPVVFDYVQKNLDWKRVTKEVEDALVRRMVSVIAPEKP